MGCMLNGGQSWLRETGGKVTLPTQRVGDWPQAYERTGFDTSLTRFRAASAN